MAAVDIEIALPPSVTQIFSPIEPTKSSISIVTPSSPKQLKLIPSSLLLKLHKNQYLRLETLSSILEKNRLEFLQQRTHFTLEKLNFKVGGIIALYEGQLQNKQPHGYGRLIIENHLVYEGEWINGKREGQGISYHRGGIISYQGDWFQGKKQGYGASFYPNKLLYRPEYFGQWSENKEHGQGALYSNLQHEPISKGTWSKDGKHILVPDKYRYKSLRGFNE